MKKTTCLVALGIALGLTGSLATEVSAELVIDENYQLIQATRIDRTRYEYTYRVKIINTGPAVQNVTAVITSSSPYTAVTDGEVVFGDLPAGNTVSVDTFSIVQDRLAPFDPSALAWEITVTQTHGGGGCGELFGDLIKIKRDPVTGQPILQKRWIEYPMDIFGWGYCPIALDAADNEIPFTDLTCDPADPEAVVEIDYFGRLSAGRARERNSRMHFNETISKIKMGERVERDATGRLKIGYDCSTDAAGAVTCASWSKVDSPVENLSLYTRLLKYGHLQTDPSEEDLWTHGDPAMGIQYHPALTPEDWLKFSADLLYLLPDETLADPDTCFGETFTTGFNLDCAEPESLSNNDFVTGATFLAAAADKTGKITSDLVQYLNRILKITQETTTTLPTSDTLPALIRDCGDDPAVQEDCVIMPADATLPWPANERFVAFQAATYSRAAWFDNEVAVLSPDGPALWAETTGVRLLDWLAFINGPAPAPVLDLNGFVQAGSDALRTIEFVHNYSIPANLGWNFTSP